MTQSKIDIPSWLDPYWLCANEYSSATSHLNNIDCLLPFNETRDIRNFVNVTLDITMLKLNYDIKTCF